MPRLHYTLHSKTRWVHLFAIGVAEWWPYGVSFIGTALLAVPSFVTSIAETRFGWSIFAFAVFCLIVAGVGIGLRERRIHTLEETVRSAEHELEESVHSAQSERRTVDEQLRKRLRMALHELMKECNLAQSGENTSKSKSWSHIRGTVYCHDAKRRVFIRLARYSDDPHLEDGGRDEYPDDEGFISAAWSEPWQHDHDYPEDYKEWLKHICGTDEEKFPRATAEKLTMQSLSLASTRIDGHSASAFGADKYGIVVIESGRKRGAKASTSKLMAESKWFPVVSALVKVKHNLMISSRKAGTGIASN